MRHIRETLFEFERVRTELDDLRGLKTGHVRIVAVDSLMVDFLPSAVEAFHADYPGVTYSVIATGPVDVTTKSWLRISMPLTSKPHSQLWARFQDR